ncbi:AcrB/AcrD/AcrF family protein [Methylococcus capsulatus str. Bath]|uniref:AcrB/AcrD/AcrF family protein n=1 Tax=Methylococcus capsulatus (strain ATCC 33009 / NCIMB 11132 / Bath) TaxID=243233 RepID=Q605X2_METCA|nr:efflux RND transporter permease subunit [Methylococcus capsulatus]AAU91638.1 AcrB/AcrD/AcrF family protein [Methylococcus capsulatus str. Bath]
MAKPNDERGLTAAIVRIFITSKLSLVFLIASFMLGAAALLLTPREEEPQIVVPVADVFVRAPGASAEEVEKLVATPLESRLREIDGVEYVYSASRAGEAMVTVRFYVGEDREDSLLKVWSKLMSNKDAIPSIVESWLVKPVEIDDVPILTFTLSSSNPLYDAATLRRLADEMKDKLSSREDTGRIYVVGGQRRTVRIHPEPARLAAHGLDIGGLMQALRGANVKLEAGSFDRADRRVDLEAGPHYASAAEVADTAVGHRDGRVVRLREVAEVIDGPAEVESYTRIGFGAAAADSRSVGQTAAARPGEERQAVTLAVAKRRGANAVSVSERVIEEVKGLYGTLIPEDVTVTISRDYGETANHKVNELVKHLFIAIVTIIVLLAFALGPKEAFIVALAVPMTLGITLLFDLVFGYTINRVTLFALILSLGLLVDDPIVDVENIYRHFKLRREPPLEAAITAVDEVRPPTIFATFTVIVSFLPMFFITGMMGPYMAPMAFNVPIAMLMSLLVAFTVTPWASYYLLKSEYGTGGAAYALQDSPVYRFYRRTLGALVLQPGRAKLFIWLMVGALVASSLLAVTRVVPLKLLPFDNKNELQLVIDMPRDASLERTDAVARALGEYLARVNEITDFETYVGLASPMDFNGMVRHYYLRRGGYVGEIRISLLPKERREQQSHEIALRIRPEVERIAARFGAKAKIVETPPGPPVLSTFVAEVYGPLDAEPAELDRVTERVRDDVAGIAGMVDVDDLVDEPKTLIRYRVDRDKAALNGLSVAALAEALEAATAGRSVGTVHVQGEREPLEIVLRLPRAERSSLAELMTLGVRGADGRLVPLGELGTLVEDQADRTIYHKNLLRLNYVTAEMAGRTPVEAVLDWGDIEDAKPLPAGYKVDLAGEGEWKITVDVFRDLGLAFGAALVMIYVLLVAQTGSLGMPLVIMVAIPLTIIGIMPGFWLLNLLFTSPVAGYDNPILFTATGMIGMIALAGIVVRNSIILIDFIERLRERGTPLFDALVEAGSTRLRPIFLTAGAAMFGSFVITLDPIFSGLAWSFIFGIFASTLFTLWVVPVVYWMINREVPR